MVGPLLPGYTNASGSFVRRKPPLIMGKICSFLVPVVLVQPNVVHQGREIGVLALGLTLISPGVFSPFFVGHCVSVGSGGRWSIIGVRLGHLFNIAFSSWVRGRAS